MSSRLSALVGFITALSLGVSFYCQSKQLKSKANDSEYAKIKQHAKKLRFKSARINAQQYSCCMEFIITDESLGMRCYWPSFAIVTKYENLTLSKSRAFIRSKVRLHISNRKEKIEISHSLAKKLAKLSGGKFRYGDI